MLCPICEKRITKIITQELRSCGGKVFYCDECDLGILEKKKKHIQEYYEKKYRTKHSFDIKHPTAEPSRIFEAYRRFQEYRLKIIRPYLSKEKKLLEIGCSAGQFLFYIHNKLKEVKAIEPNLACAAFVEKRLGVEVHRGRLETRRYPARYFDIICSFHVLEHTEEPVNFLRQCTYPLKDNGYIFIEVPNLHDSLLSAWRIEFYRKFFFHEAHNYYFSIKSLEKIARKAGLRIRKTVFIQDYNIINHFHWFFKNQPQDNCIYGLSKPQLTFADKYRRFGYHFNRLLQKLDTEYKKLLSSNKIASNILLVLSKR